MPLKVLRMFWRNSHSRMLFLDETIRSLPNAYYKRVKEVVSAEAASYFFALSSCNHYQIKLALNSHQTRIKFESNSNQIRDSPNLSRTCHEDITKLCWI